MCSMSVATSSFLAILVAGCVRSAGIGPPDAYVPGDPQEDV